MKIFIMKTIIQMKTFKLMFDTKCTVWERGFYKIDAESQDKAVVTLKELIDKGEQFVDGSFLDSETLYDTLEPMTIEQNNGFATEEILIRRDNGDYEILHRNGPEPLIKS